MRDAALLFFGLGLAACGPGVSPTTGDDTAADAMPAAPDAAVTIHPDAGGETGCGALDNCFSVFAHGDHTLYVIDLQARTLETVGPFDAPQVTQGSSTHEDVITDLAVAPDNTIYAISETAIYTADPADGHVTQVGSLAACGTKTVALTSLPTGEIYAGDYMGALCEIDVTTSPPTVLPPVSMSDGLALAGDLVAIGDGTVFGTAYRLSDAASTGTQVDNLLVTIDVATGATTVVGDGSGFPKLFGASFALGEVFGFTHDGTGDVVTIDTATGAGTLYASFTDPATGTGIRFAGAGVNALIIVD